MLSINKQVHTVELAISGLIRTRPNIKDNSVTILQLLQMIIGIIINLTLYSYHSHFNNCDYDADVFLFGLLLYLSYAILFGHYFINRYIRKKDKNQ